MRAFFCDGHVICETCVFSEATSLGNDPISGCLNLMCIARIGVGKQELFNGCSAQNDVSLCVGQTKQSANATTCDERKIKASALPD